MSKNPSSVPECWPNASGDSHQHIRFSFHVELIYQRLRCSQKLPVYVDRLGHGCYYSALHEHTVNSGGDGSIWEF